MALQSSLFRGDPKLEAAAVSDQAHITLGATGPHVKKIQLSQKGREWHEQATKRPIVWRIQSPNTQTMIEAKGGSGEVSSPIHKIAP